LIPIIPSSFELTKTAEVLAAHFQLPLLDWEAVDLPHFILRLTAERLELQDTQTDLGCLSAEFVKGPLGYRLRHGGGYQQPLAKAIGVKANRCPFVLDLTAGLGREAFVLAGLGCQVEMIERCSAIAALLEEGLQRATRDVKSAEIVNARLRLIHGEAQTRLSLLQAAGSITSKPEVIYLDPMYPVRKKSAKVKKEMRILQAVVGMDEDGEKLLEQALACPVKKVVVKRPRYACCLNGIQPNFSVGTENTRYDVYHGSSFYVRP